MERQYRNPLLTVDIIIEINNGIVLIERKNPPACWALPGGFVDYGESLEACAIREAKEETSLDIIITEQFHTYSAPDRDPRHHSVTTVYIATASGVLKAADDAKNAAIFFADGLPNPMAFDHGKIINDYLRYRIGASKLEVFSEKLNVND